MLEEFESHLAAEETRRKESQIRLDKSSKILTDVKSGVEHLAEKLKNLKAVSFQFLSHCQTMYRHITLVLWDCSQKQQ